MIKALPNKIMSYSLETIELFNFRIFREALNAYQNLDIVHAFEHFDEKNKQRVQKIKSKVFQQTELVDGSSILLDMIREHLEKDHPMFRATTTYGFNSMPTGISED